LSKNPKYTFYTIKSSRDKKKIVASPCGLISSQAVSKCSGNLKSVHSEFPMHIWHGRIVSHQVTSPSAGKLRYINTFSSSNLKKIMIITYNFNYI
jgi:hypothetical protein